MAEPGPRVRFVSVSGILILVAIILMALAAFGVTFGGVQIVPLALCLFMASFLV